MKTQSFDLSLEEMDPQPEGSVRKENSAMKGSPTQLLAASSTPTQTKFNWQEFWVLTGAGIFGCLAVLPLILPLLKSSSGHISRLASIPLWAQISLRLVPTVLLVAGCVAVGVGLGKRCGLGAPILEAWLAGQRVGKRFVGILWLAIPAGVLVAAVALTAEKYFFAPRMPELAQLAGTIAEPAIWKGFLASFYGGINEELGLRFGFLTLFVWALGKVSHTVEARPTAAAFWVANLLAAVLFGAGHLPATAALIPLTKMVVLRAIVLNGFAGIILGWLYWKRGLESAIVAHFSADLVVHVIAPAWLIWFKH